MSTYQGEGLCRVMTHEASTLATQKGRMEHPVRNHWVIGGARFLWMQVNHVNHG